MPSLPLSLLKLPLTERYCSQAVFVICEMVKGGHIVNESVAGDAIELCCYWNQPRLALELAELFLADPAYNTEMLAAVRSEILISCAENDYVGTSTRGSDSYVDVSTR